MSMPILATKLYVPPPRPKIVLRPRLIEQLNKGFRSGHKLTLISAPAGFGKTTLVSAWVAGCGQTVAWLSLDEEDNDPARFLTYLVTALQTISPNIGEGVLGMLQSPQPPPIESILTTLLNEITTIPDNFILILDDYHLIDAKPIDNALTFLLKHLPPQMHLVITTREDPQLPLARLRSRDQLTELRVADLRFTPIDDKNQFTDLSQMNQQLAHKRQIIANTIDPFVLDPATVALDPAIGKGLVGGFASYAGQLAIPSQHNPTDQGGQSGQVSGYIPFRFSWIHLLQSHSNDTIDTTIVTHGFTPVLPWREKHSVPSLAVVICKSVR